MSLNIPKKIIKRKRNQPSRDLEDIMERSRKKNLMSNEEGLESEYDRLKDINDDHGL